MYRNTQESDTGIDTIFNISIYRVSQYIDMNITYITVFVIRRYQFSIKLLWEYCHRVRKEEIFVCVLKENLTYLHCFVYHNIFMYRDIFGAMHH